jgi:signal transduction histidine kinase
LIDGNSDTRLPQDPLHGNQNARSLQKANHEIRSIAQGLLGYLAIFTEETRTTLNEDQIRLLTRINDFAQKLADQVTDLLDANRGEGSPPSAA